MYYQGLDAEQTGTHLQCTSSDKRKPVIKFEIAKAAQCYLLFGECCPARWHATVLSPTARWPRAIASQYGQVSRCGFWR